MIPIGQAFGTEAQIAEYLGRTDRVGQLVWSTDGHRLYVMDGSTKGGYAVAMRTEMNNVQSALTTLDSQSVKTVTQTLDSTKQEQALTNLGVIDALEELITEYGGTVPTNANSVQTLSASDDPWADLGD